MLMLTQNELLALHQLLRYFIDKSSSSTFHLPPPAPEITGTPQEPATKVLMVDTEWPPTPFSG